MSVMRCGCGRLVDLDWHLEDWDDASESCAWCAEEEQTQQAAAMAAEDEQ